MSLTVDASALLLLERRPALAAAVLARFPLMAPRLICWEVGQVIHVKRKAEFGALGHRQRVVADLLQPVTCFDQSGSLAAIAACAERQALSFYDAAYLQLAIELDTALLTEDERMHKAAAKALGASRAWRLADVERAVSGTG